MKIGFESGGMSINSRDREPKRLNEETLSEIETIVSKKMEPLDLEEIGEAIGVPLEEIAADKEYVLTTKDKISRSDELREEMKKKKKELQGLDNEEVSRYYERLGHAFEGFLYSNISNSRIFKDVILHKTAEVDDIRNGVDFVAEYENPKDPKSYIALAMDASFSMSPALINRKIERSLKDIGKNELSKVRYFQFEEGALEARLGIPRVVVGTDEYGVKSILERWHTKETIEESGISFEEDPIWTFMALQISEQLKMFIEEAKFHNKLELANICEKYLTALNKSLLTNRDLVEKHKLIMERDGTSIAINEFCVRNARELTISQKIHKDSAQQRRDDEMYESIFLNK